MEKVRFVLVDGKIGHKKVASKPHAIYIVRRGVAAYDPEQDLLYVQGYVICSYKGLFICEKTGRGVETTCSKKNNASIVFAGVRDLIKESPGLYSGYIKAEHLNRSRLAYTLEPIILHGVKNPAEELRKLDTPRCEVCDTELTAY